MSSKTFATFRLGDQLFGVEVLFVREINKQIDITVVQHAPEFIRGLVNLRGQIVTVMDLLQRIKGSSTKLTDQTCNLILKTDQEITPIRNRESREDLVSSSDTIGLLVDEIDEIITVEDEEIDPPPTNMDKNEGNYLDGVVKLDGELLAILSVPRVLQAA